MLGLPLPRITICGRWHRTQSACPHQKSRIDPSYPHPRILLCGLDSHKFRKGRYFSSCPIVVVGLDPKTEKARQLAHIAGTDPMRHDNSFTTSAPIMRSEMLPVVVLCMLYA